MFPPRRRSLELTTPPVDSCFELSAAGVTFEMNERLRVLIAEMLDLQPGEVTPGMRREETETWDSLNHLRLITAIETEFATAFTMDEIAQLQTPGDLQRVIEARDRPQPHVSQANAQRLE